MERLKRGDSAPHDGILISEVEYERLRKDKEILDGAEQILSNLPRLSSSINEGEKNGKSKNRTEC